MGSANIMIVEDNATVAEDCCESLKALGYDVTAIVASGEECIEKVYAEPPDAVLMDIHLRDEMDGIEAAERIQGRFDIPVVFLSAYSDRGLIERANRVGSFGYLVKPFNERALYATLEMAIYKGKVEKERKQAEKDRAKLEDQLRQSQKMESIGTLAGGIAHEFNNILGIIVGNTELALNDVPEWNQARHNLGEVMKASLRARDVVKQILDFSRQRKQESKPIRITPVWEESLKLLRASIPTTVEILQNFSAHDDTIRGDTAQIRQILMNLCANAAHAMREKGGVLEVSLENIELNQDAPALHPDLTAGNYVLLTVSDTGHGIAPEIVGRIFDPYFTTKKVGEGTGMGLSVALGIVSNHGGAIRVESGRGQGSTFQVFLPLLPEEANLESEVEAETIMPLLKGNERVLFVDDEKALTDLAERVLSHCGYHVTVRTSSVEALEAFRAEPDKFDLVVTDMTMPNMTGMDLSQELLRLRPDISIILCTGFSDMVTEEKAKQMGIKAFVMKPVALRKIAQTIRQVLDRKPPVMCYSVPQETVGQTVRCREDFACLENRDHCLCKRDESIHYAGDTVLFVEPSRNAPASCSYKKLFGDSHFICTCQTRIEIFKRYGK